MKKSRSARGVNEYQKKSKSVKICEPEKTDRTDKSGHRSQFIDDEDYGFGGWLRSSEGMAMLKLFVIGNSIVVFSTMTWPSVQTAYGIITDWLTGEDPLD